MGRPGELSKQATRSQANLTLVYVVPQWILALLLATAIDINNIRSKNENIGTQYFFKL
jgi:hypothetical protein